jgi:hypothetical protein
LTSGFSFPGGAYIAGADGSMKMIGDTISVIPDLSGAIAVHGTSAQNAFFVGADGSIKHFDGQNIVAMASGTTVRLRAIYVASDTFAVAGGGDRDGPGVLVGFDGSAWHPMALPVATKRVYSLNGTGPNNLWLGTEDGQLLQWNGSIWSLKARAATAIRDIVVDAQGTPWIATRNGVFAYWNGTQLVTTMTTGGRGNLGIDSGQLYAISGTFAFWWNGTTWLQFVNQLPFPARVLVAGNGNVITTGRGGKLARLNAKFWHRPPPFVDPAYNSAWVAPTGEIFSGGFFGRLNVYRNGAWQQSLKLATERIESIWGTSAGNVYAVSRSQSGGRIYHWNGTTWNAEIDGAISFRFVTGIDASHVYVAADDGNIRAWDGTAWSVMNANFQSRAYQVVALSPTNLYAVGSSAVKRFDGSTWQTMISGPQLGSVRSIAVINGSDIWIQGRLGNASYRMHFDGAAWSAKQDTGGTQRRIFTLGPNQLISVARSGGASVFIDSQWSEILVPDNESQFENYDVTRFDDRSVMICSSANASILRSR